MKKGFTLAETLITLGIIGVVASITMPAIIENQQKQKTVSLLKKAYNTLCQVVPLSQVDNGDIKSWDFTRNTFDTYIAPYIKSIKKCKQCKVNYSVKSFNGAICSINENICHRHDSSNLVYTPDGMIFYFGNSGATGRANFTLFTLGVDVDINGAKGPNRYGKDIFKFEISSDYGVKPYGYGPRNSNWNRFGLSFRDPKDDSAHGCIKTATYGFYCTAKIIADGWKIKDDYPW